MKHREYLPRLRGDIHVHKNANAVAVRYRASSHFQNLLEFAQVAGPARGHGDVLPVFFRPNPLNVILST